MGFVSEELNETEKQLIKAGKASNMAVVYGKEASIWKVRPARPPVRPERPPGPTPACPRSHLPPTADVRGEAWLGLAPCPPPHPCSAPNSDQGL